MPLDAIRETKVKYHASLPKPVILNVDSPAFQSVYYRGGIVRMQNEVVS